MPAPDQFQDILENILSHDQTPDKVQFLVYHVAVKGQEAFDELAGRFEGRVDLDKTIVIVSGVDQSLADERMYLYCHVSRDLEGSYNRRVIIDKINHAYQSALAQPGRRGKGGPDPDAAMRRAFGADFIQLFEDNNLLN
jgi:hypothetical protein